MSWVDTKAENTLRRASYREKLYNGQLETSWELTEALTRLRSIQPQVMMHEIFDHLDEILSGFNESLNERNEAREDIEFTLQNYLSSSLINQTQLNISTAHNDCNLRIDNQKKQDDAFGEVVSKLRKGLQAIMDSQKRTPSYGYACGSPVREYLQRFSTSSEDDLQLLEDIELVTFNEVSQDDDFERLQARIPTFDRKSAFREGSVAIIKEVTDEIKALKSNRKEVIEFHRTFKEAWIQSNSTVIALQASKVARKVDTQIKVNRRLLAKFDTSLNASLADISEGIEQAEFELRAVVQDLLTLCGSPDYATMPENELRSIHELEAYLEEPTTVAAAARFVDTSTGPYHSNSSHWYTENVRLVKDALIETIRVLTEFNASAAEVDEELMAYYRNTSLYGVNLNCLPLSNDCVDNVGGTHSLASPQLEPNTNFEPAQPGNSLEEQVLLRVNTMLDFASEVAQEFEARVNTFEGVLRIVTMGMHERASARRLNVLLDFFNAAKLMPGSLHNNQSYAGEPEAKNRDENNALLGYMRYRHYANHFFYDQPFDIFTGEYKRIIGPQPFMDYPNMVGTGNWARTGNGGAIMAFDSDLKITDNSRIENGIAPFGYGGGVYVFSSRMTVKESVFTHNHAIFGGAISSGHSKLTIKHSTLNQNLAYRDGGALHSIQGGTTTLDSSTLADNFVDCPVRDSHLFPKVKTSTSAPCPDWANTRVKGAPESGGPREYCMHPSCRNYMGDGGSAFIKSGKFLKIIKSTFADSESKHSGGCLSVIDTIDTTVDESTFTRCTVVHLTLKGPFSHKTEFEGTPEYSLGGGAISLVLDKFASLEDTRPAVKQTVFRDNFVQRGTGGAIFWSVPPAMFSRVEELGHFLKLEGYKDAVESNMKPLASGNKVGTEQNKWEPNFISSGPFSLVVLTGPKHPDWVDEDPIWIQYGYKQSHPYGCENCIKICGAQDGEAQDGEGNERTRQQCGSKARLEFGLKKNGS
jgi:hypothetical protein